MFLYRISTAQAHDITQKLQPVTVLQETMQTSYVKAHFIRKAHIPCLSEQKHFTSWILELKAGKKKCIRLSLQMNTPPS